MCRGGPEVPLISARLEHSLPMSYQVIARKHRPQRFEELVGQSHVTQTLQNAIRTGRVAHAYIFSGARGVGKTTTARILAKALNCEQGPTPTPCGACPACREIAAGTSLDVIEIDAASNRGIDQIRELREMVRYAPAAGRYKVVILDEAHMLTDEASNALLKTLEEPPEKTIFVMATTQPEDLVETIRSRSQHFHFRALAFSEITAALAEIARKEDLTIDDGARAVLARSAEGSLRDALSLVEQAVSYCGNTIRDADARELLGVVPEEVLDELMDAVGAGSAERALGLVHQLLAEGRNLQHFCREAIRHVRDLLVARVAGADSPLIAATAEQRPRLKATAARFSEEDLTRYFQILLYTDDDLRRKPDARLHLEMGLLRMVNARRLAPLEELLAELKGERAAISTPPRAASYPATPASGPRALAAAAGAAMGSASGRETAVPEQGAQAAGTGAEKPPRMAPLPAALPSAVAKVAAQFDGLAATQVDAIKAAILAQQKFLGELVEHASRWELAGSEMRLYFSPANKALADLLQAREQIERLRTITSQVMGQPLRVCVRLEPLAAAVAKPRMALNVPELRAKFEQDPIVQAMLERFGGRISDVKRGEE